MSRHIPTNALTILAIIASAMRQCCDNLSCYHNLAWIDFATTQINAWSSFVLDWLKFAGPLYISRFESVLLNLRHELDQILSFLNGTISRPDLECILIHKDGVFKRPNKRMFFDPFNVTLTGESSGNKAAADVGERGRGAGDGGNTPTTTLRQLVEQHKKVVYDAINRLSTEPESTVNVLSAATGRAFHPASLASSSTPNQQQTVIKNNDIGNGETSQMTTTLATGFAVPSRLQSYPRL